MQIKCKTFMLEFPTLGTWVSVSRGPGKAGTKLPVKYYSDNNNRQKDYSSLDSTQLLSISNTALNFTAVDFLHSFTCDYVALCAHKGVRKMVERKLCVCIADDLPDSLHNDVEVASVGNSNIKVLHLICVLHIISGWGNSN